MNKENERLLKKAYILLVIAFIGVIVVINCDFKQQESILCIFSGIISMLCTILAGMIAFYLVGYNDAVKKIGEEK